MLEIRNLLFQPLTLHLAKSNESIHLTSRGKAIIKDDALSLEIQRAQAKGWVTVKTVEAQEAQPVEPVTKKRRGE